MSRLTAHLKRSFRRELADVPIGTAVQEVYEEHIEQISNTDVYESTNGVVRITDGKIHIVDPQGDGSFATLHVPDDPRIWILRDGERVVGRTFLTSTCAFTAQMNHEEPKVQMVTRVFDDQMSVYMKIEVLVGQRYSLGDCECVRHANIDLVAEEWLPGPRDLRVLKEHLTAEGLQGDIDFSTLSELSTTTETKELVVVRGQPPVPGRVATFRPVDLPKEYDPLRKRMTITTVSVGTTIAIRQDEVQGIPGRDVFGNPVDAPKEGITPVLGRGVSLVSNKLVAAINGRFVITRTRIDVVPELVIRHDVSPKVGKVIFDGDVVVYGSVLDGGFIRATGSVKVHGSVMAATVVAQKGVFVSQAIVGSKIVSGQSHILYGDLHPYMKEVVRKFSSFRTEYLVVLAQALKNKVPTNRVLLIPHVLIEQRHSELERYFQLICDRHDRDLLESDDVFVKVLQEIRTKWSGAGRTNISKHDVEHFARILTDYFDSVDILESTDIASVRASSITSSVVRSSGDVSVNGTGVYASTIESGRALTIRGIVKGGFLHAEKAIRVAEVGTPFGTETIAKVKDPQGFIAIRTRHPNTTLVVAEQRNKNWTLEHNVIFRRGTNDDSNTAGR